jgi:phosphohistidine phosphatase
MDLYIIRHAEAQPLGERTISADADRPLTEAGKAQARLLAQTLQRLGVKLDVLLTSPLLRARQTAEEMLSSWKAPVPELQVTDELAPGGKRKGLSRFLRELEKEAVGLVGHQPDLGLYAAWLIGSKKIGIDLDKTGTACIQCPKGPRKRRGTLIWLVTPAWLASGHWLPQT